MSLKLCIFPNDPIIAYYKKGEIKDRYFNPGNLFDEIHIISFSEKEIEEDKVKNLAGNAKMKIYCVGKINYFNKNKKKKMIMNLVKQINPDVIRSYNTLLEGWCAAYCSHKLNIPFFVSIHVQYDGLRNLVKTQNIKKYLALKYSRKKIEPYVLQRADKITAVYRIIEPYVKELSNKNVEILYNRIDLSKFESGKKILDYKKPIILSVGRLTKQKNHEIIIDAIRDIDVNLIIIGDGELREKLEKKVEKLGIKEKIIFKKSVPNKEIQNYYKSADIFVLAYDTKVEGVPIPILEAMASGIPVIIPKVNSEFSDGLENSVEMVDLKSNMFALKINEILLDRKKMEELSKKGKEKSKKFDGKTTEKRESEIYKKLISLKKSP